VEIRSISAAAALKVAAIVFAVFVALRFLWIAHAIFIVTLLGVLLGLALSRAVDFLERFRIRRGLGAPLTLLFFLALLVGIGAFLAPSIREQTGQIAQELPKAMRQIEEKIGSSKASRALGIAPQQQQQQQPPQQKPQQQEQGGQQGDPQQKPQQAQQPQQQQQPPQQQQQGGGGLTAQLGKELRNATRFLFPIISSVFGAVAGLVIVLFIAMYIAATPGLYREGLVHLVPHQHRDRAREVFGTLGETLRQWLIARLLAMVAIGLITGLGLALLGVKGAAALGVLAGLLELIPFFGPFVSAIPAVAIAMVDSPQKALLVLGLYVIVQQLEGNVITPLILEKRLDIPPVLTVVAVSAMGVVFGVLGMLVAEPLLAAALVLAKMLYVQDVVGDDVKVGKNG
jgi:predicted PurR-regulated permease PerM